MSDVPPIIHRHNVRHSKWWLLPLIISFFVGLFAFVIVLFSNPTKQPGIAFWMWLGAFGVGLLSCIRLIRSRNRGLIAIGAICSLLGTAVMLLIVSDPTPDKTGFVANREQSPIRKLPFDAKNISYCRLSPNFYYEFDTSEEGFRKWVAEQKRAMGPIRREHASIMRCDYLTGESSIYEIDDALISEWTGTQADDGQHLVYDLENRRAFFWSHSR